MFEKLDARFHFTLDAAASFDNALCQNFFTAEQDALTKSWKGERVWCNPPYARGELAAWCKKFKDESDGGALVVALLPFRVGSRWFLDWVFPYADLYVHRGRIRFDGAPNAAPFDSVLAIYNGLNEDWVRL